MSKNMINRAIVGLATGLALLATPALAETGAEQRQNFEASFDTVLGTEVRAPQVYRADYDSNFERLIAGLADGSKGRIGVAAMDLTTGQSISILGDQRFPMASTSKIAIAATFLEGVDQGRWSLTSEFPLMVPQSSSAFSTRVAPVKPGAYLSASTLLDIMITRSNNQATDALLKVVGGPQAVNDWARRAGITDFTLSRDIATLVRDDGEIDPARQIDLRDSATPQAMVQMLAGLHEGKWLSRSSRNLIINTMERTRTGKRRIRGLMPADVTVANKTGSLNNTSSDIGFITGPDGHTIAVAIYVTGQGARPNRESRIASIARGLYDGYQTQIRHMANARYSRPGTVGSAN
ncbi:serine hydrolase [Altererythrobacter sp. CAU 1778]